MATDNLMRKEPHNHIIIIDGAIIQNKELIQFYSDFSERHKHIEAGIYLSDDKNCCIKYIDAMEQGTPARIGKTSGVIQLDKNNLCSNYKSNDYVYFLLIWCAVMNKIDDTIQADRIVIKHYLQMGRSKKELLKGHSVLCSAHQSPLNEDRLDQLIEMWAFGFEESSLEEAPKAIETTFSKLS